MKVNINNFSKNSMLAKLLIIQTEFERKRDIMLADRLTFDTFANDKAEENFEFEPTLKERVVMNLQLFLLGSDNVFSRTLEL